MRKVRPFACKRIRNYAASGSTDSIEEDCGGGIGSPDRTLEEASRVEEEEINRSVRGSLRGGNI